MCCKYNGLYRVRLPPPPPAFAKASAGKPDSWRRLPAIAHRAKEGFDNNPIKPRYTCFTFTSSAVNCTRNRHTSGYRRNLRRASSNITKADRLTLPNTALESLSLTSHSKLENKRPSSKLILNLGRAVHLLKSDSGRLHRSLDEGWCRYHVWRNGVCLI